MLAMHIVNQNLFYHIALSGIKTGTAHLSGVFRIRPYQIDINAAVVRAADRTPPRRRRAAATSRLLVFGIGR